MSLTIYDIASLAGTSVSTVSRYLNHKPIREENKKKIEAVLEGEGKEYTPNAMARALVSKSLKTVAIITVDIRVPHYAMVSYAFEQEFTKKGYNVIICNASLSNSKLENYLTSLLSRQIDGIALVGSIFTALNNEPKILEMLKDIPVVVANGTINMENCNSVLADDTYGTGLAVDYLLKKGRKNIYYFSDEKNDSGIRKLEGFWQGMTRNKLDPSKYQRDVAQTIDGGIDGVKGLIDSNLPFDGIICGNDIVGVGVISYLNRKGYKVGQDVDVISFNNTLYSEITYPRMTVINNKPDLQAKWLVDILERKINKEEVTSVTISTELLIKESA